MARIDVVKTTFQSRKQHTVDGIERGEYIKGMGFVGIIEVCLLVHDDSNGHRRFTRYLRWNDAELDCAENEVLSTYDDARRSVLWDALISRVLDVSTVGGWTNDAVIRFQVITTKGEPQLLVNVDEPRKREYPTVSTLREFMPSLPFVQESALMRPQDDNTLHRNIRLRIHDGNLVILKTYDERETSPELIVEARNLDRLAGSYYFIKLLGALVVENYYCVPGPDMISGLLLEYAPLGDLGTILKQHDLVTIPWQRRLNWAYQIAHGIADMHTLNIIHGDIKCSNIVVKADDNLAIIDLGEGGRTEGYYWDDDLRKMGGDIKLQKCGDIYALGVVLWQLTEFRKPVHGQAPVVKESSLISSEYSSIVAACVVADSLLRPSALEVLERLEKLPL